MRAFICVCALALVLFANNTLDVYLDRAVVSKNIDLKDGNASITVPFDLKRDDIDISCEVLDFSFSNFRKFGNSSIKDSLNNRLIALKDSYELAKVSELNSLKDIESVSKFLETNLKEQNEITSKLELMNFTDSEVIYVKDLNIKANCKNITVRYPINNVFIDSKNIINTDLKNITIKQNITISGLKDDIKNSTINFYPYNTSYGNTPGKFTPIYIHKEENKVLDAPATMSIQKAEVAMEERVNVKKVSEKTIHSFNFWQIDNFDLKANQENYITINTQNVEANITNYIDGYATSKAYVMATFIPKFDIQEADTSFYIDNNFITNSYKSKALKNQELSLFFGLNNFIEVKKENLNLKSGDNLLGTKESTKTLKGYTIINNSNKSQDVIFVERVPVSTHEDIKVDVLGSLKADAEGKVEKKFTLKPKESVNFEFGYIVTKPVK